MSCSPALFRHNDNKCTTLMGEAVTFQPDRPGKPLLFLLPDRSPARSPAAGASLHHSTEDLRVRRSANYGRLCECVLCHCATASSRPWQLWRVNFQRLSKAEELKIRICLEFSGQVWEEIFRPKPGLLSEPDLLP